MKQSPKKILIVPLDWGLGHATRCIPIIRELLKSGAIVHIGGTEMTNKLLRLEFENLHYHDYPSYAITYPENKIFFIPFLMLQMPRMALKIFQEKRITSKLVNAFHFNVIISDNRFGVRDSRCKNVFITHQIQVRIPQSRLLEKITNRINRFFIHHFQLLAVPDWSNHFLSGALSNTGQIRMPIRYLGNLSRWQLDKPAIQGEGVLAILSGPEPQRTEFENLLIKQAHVKQIKMTIIRARPTDYELRQDEYVEYHNHLTAEQLRQLVLNSEIVISRAGYSTIMDLVALRKHAILISTPGQTEQEYLAQHLGRAGLFHFYEQEEFDLEKAISAFRKMQWNNFPSNENGLSDFVNALITS